MSLPHINIFQCISSKLTKNHHKIIPHTHKDLPYTFKLLYLTQSQKFLCLLSNLAFSVTAFLMCIFFLLTWCSELLPHELFMSSASDDSSEFNEKSESLSEQSSRLLPSSI